MDHKGTQRIQTSRLILRRFVMEDAEAVFRNWANDKTVTTFLSWAPHESVEVTKQVLQDWISQYQKKDYYTWGIELKEAGEVIGVISIVRQNEKVNSAEVGYCMGTKWWGLGIMPEALKAIISYLFNEVGFNRIEGKHDRNNPKSGRVMQKAGMQYEGTLRQADKNNQGIIDVVWYSILKQDYLESGD